jgi:hypothetical protein
MSWRQDRALDESSDEFLRRVNRFFQEIVFGFIFQDIDRCVGARANFLAALGLLAYTEFLGGLQTGLLGSYKPGDAKRRFTVFFRELGGEYGKLAEGGDTVDVWRDVRNGLVHAYFIDQRATIKMSIGDGHGDRCGIEVEGGHIWFIVQKYFDDFRRAAMRYHEQLVVDRDQQLVGNFRLAVGSRWYFHEIGAGE